MEFEDPYHKNYFLKSILRGLKYYYWLLDSVNPNIFSDPQFPLKRQDILLTISFLEAIDEKDQVNFLCQSSPMLTWAMESIEIYSKAKPEELMLKKHQIPVFLEYTLICGTNIIFNRFRNEISIQVNKLPNEDARQLLLENKYYYLQNPGSFPEKLSKEVLPYLENLISKYKELEGIKNDKPMTQTTSVEKDSSQQLPVIVVLTAIQEEYKAVRAHLSNNNEINIEGTIYEQGIFRHNEADVATVFIRECGPKNTTASQDAQRAVSHFKPQCMFFVGIGGSRKPQDFEIGDVIFPDRICYYEGGKSEEENFNARPDCESTSYDLFELAKQERNKEDWKTLIKEDWEKYVKANIGSIASGEKILEHYNSELGKLITAHYNDAAVIEMEGFGFTKALKRQGMENQVMIGVVRGISDIVERGSSADKQPNGDRRPAENKRFASDTASAFAFWLIYKHFSEKNVPVKKNLSQKEELEIKALRLKVKPRLNTNGGTSNGFEGKLQLRLENKGELATLTEFKVLEGNVALHNENLPWELEKGTQRMIFLRTINKAIINETKYKISVDYKDEMDFKYRIIIEGKGAACKITETIEK